MVVLVCIFFPFPLDGSFINAVEGKYGAGSVGWEGRGIARRRFLETEKRRKMKYRAGTFKKSQQDANESLDYSRDKNCNGDTMIRRLDNDIEKADIQDATMLVNFDKVTMKKMLIKKERSVGEIVLVDGRPAVIKKRIVGREGEMLRRYAVGTLRRLGMVGRNHGQQ